MSTKTWTPFSCSLGLALGEVHWSLTTDPLATDLRGTDPPAISRDRARPLPATDLDVHVTGDRGSPPDDLRSLAGLLRRILASGRERPTPVEQDYVTGYVRHLLLVPTSTYFLDPLQLKTELNCAYVNSDAAQAM